jgi:sulfatase-like protein
MDSKMFSRLLLFDFCLTGWLLLPTKSTAQTRPPHIVIVADDFGYADLGCQAAKDIKTPHIDGRVSKGVRCTSGYAAALVGGPTRAALVTGRFPPRFGFEFNPPHDAKSDYGLPLTEPLSNAVTEPFKSTLVVSKYFRQAKWAAERIWRF